MKESIRTVIDMNVNDWVKDSNVDYSKILSQAGFYYVDLNWKIAKQPVHEWCIEHIGYENYNWTGARFWFQNYDQAVLFALKWA